MFLRNIFFWDCFLCLILWHLFQVERLGIENHLLADPPVFFYLFMSCSLICGFLYSDQKTHELEKLSASKHNIIFPCVNSWSKNKRLCLSLCICGRKIIASNKSSCQYIAHEFVLSTHLRFCFLKYVFWILCVFNFI